MTSSPLTVADWRTRFHEQLFLRVIVIEIVQLIANLFLDPMFFLIFIQFSCPFLTWTNFLFLNLLKIYFVSYKSM